MKTTYVALMLSAFLAAFSLSGFAASHKHKHAVKHTAPAKQVSMNCSVHLDNNHGMTLDGGFDQAHNRVAECGAGAALKIGPSFNANSNMELASYVCDMSKPVNSIDASGDGTLFYAYCSYKGVPGNFSFQGIPITVVKTP